MNLNPRSWVRAMWRKFRNLERIELQERVIAQIKAQLEHEKRRHLQVLEVLKAERDQHQALDDGLSASFAASDIKTSAARCVLLRGHTHRIITNDGAPPAVFYSPDLELSPRRERPTKDLPIEVVTYTWRISIDALSSAHSSAVAIGEARRAVRGMESAIADLFRGLLDRRIREVRSSIE